MSINVLLISDEMIKERTVIHGNIDPKLIYPDIKVAQDLYIMPLLGTALFDKLQTLITNGTISVNPDYEILLNRYIVDALMYYTLSELPMTLSYQFWNKGIVRKQGENTETPSMSDLLDLSNRYKQRAESYSQRLILYLKQNASTKFTEYNNPGNGIDTVHPENRGFTMPVYIGNDGNRYCNDGGFSRKPYEP